LEIDALKKGMKLNFTMIDKPNKVRGTKQADLPYSFSSQDR
jgi:putative alpha-1,2-mannosidase